MTREQIFGRLIAIATVLGDRVLPKGAPSIASQFLDKVGRNPLSAFAQAHNKLMQHAHKFGPEEITLMDMFGELLNDLDPDDESLHKPLSGDYLISYYKEKVDLFDLVGVAEAAELLGWSKQQVNVYMQRDKFPQPIRRLASGPLWTRRQIEEFMEARK